MNIRLSQEMNSAKRMMHAQIKKAIISAKNDSVLPEIHSTVGISPLTRKDIRVRPLAIRVKSLTGHIQNWLELNFETNESTVLSLSVRSNIYTS